MSITIKYHLKSQVRIKSHVSKKSHVSIKSHVSMTYCLNYKVYSTIRFEFHLLQ